MTLRDLVENLANRNNIQITLRSTAGVELITFKGSGYEALEDAIETSEVTSWSLVPAQNSISVTLLYPQTTETTESR